METCAARLWQPDKDNCTATIKMAAVGSYHSVLFSYPYPTVVVVMQLSQLCRHGCGGTWAGGSGRGQQRHHVVPEVERVMRAARPGLPHRAGRARTDPPAAGRALLGRVVHRAVDLGFGRIAASESEALNN